MDLKVFIRDRFGEESVKEISAIRRGGDNNNKGVLFENHFAVAKIYELAALYPDRLENFILSAQEDSFVDDLCVLFSIEKHKENFQLKNSDGYAAHWTDEIEERFYKQTQIDAEFHNCLSSRQILLVSSEDVARKNNEKIPIAMRSNCCSEFFPYRESVSALILEHERLRESIKACIKKTSNSADIDAAFTVVFGIWTSCDRKKKSVGDVFADAKRLCRPNLFKSDFTDIVIPNWLHKLCVAFEQIKVSAASGSIKVMCNGFEINLGSHPKEPSMEELQALKSLDQVLFFLMTCISNEL